MIERGNLSRRGFMTRSTAALVATGLPAWYAGMVVESQQAQAADEPKKAVEVTVAAIGIGSPQSRGRAIYGEAKRVKGVRYVAACDVDARHLKNATAMMTKDGFADVKGYEDYRELLKDKNIQAVTIATPDHWHALVAIEALRQGKDVYCEKPLSLTIGDGRAMVDANKKYGRVFQTGSQQRSEMNGMFRLAVELVRSGRIGKISKIECRIGGNPTSPSLPKVPVPEGLNWDMWLGPTPKVDYCELGGMGKPIQTRCHYEYRWWYEYSGGKMTDWGAHHLDIAQWALNMDGKGPMSIEVNPEKTKAPSKDANSYNCHPQFEVIYTYPGGVQVLAQSDGDNGAKFYGENGQWIFVSRGKIQASDPKLISEALPKGTPDVYSYRPTNHMANFFDCIASRKSPIADVTIGHSSATVCHLGVIAMQLGKKIGWNWETEKFDSEEANAKIARPYRAPWKLEV